MKNTRYGNGDLPQELLQYILVRLPVKVLSRCKCVSKNWCSLIESRNFVKCHFERSKERLLIRLVKERDQEGNEYAVHVDEPVPEQEEPQIPDQEEDQDEEALYYAEMIADYERMVAYFENEYHRELAEQERCTYALYSDETFSEYEEPIHLQIPEEVTDVFGPLNGVFCVAAMHNWGAHMALLNPALRQFKPLPRIALVLPTTTFHQHVLGFGLDPFTGDYKLVSLLYSIDITREDQFSQCVVSVCTSDSDSWRVLEDVDSVPLTCSASMSLCNTYLNGAYYWLLDDYHTTDVAILAFDMGTDKFREIHVAGCDADQSKRGHLALCGDSLALLIHDKLEHYASRFIDVWIMKNEGCWIKSSRVGPLEGISWPVCFWNKNELLLETTTLFLARCNVSTQEMEIFEAKRKYLDHFSHWGFAYKESLVSIKGETGNCMLWDTSSDLVKDFFKELSNEEVPIVV